jgi:hypothetical protein
MSECAHLGEDGRCLGRYHGIICIGEKCLADKAVCEHLSPDGGYCHKYHRFACVGLKECQGGMDAALLRKRQKKRARK